MKQGEIEQVVKEIYETMFIKPDDAVAQDYIYKGVTRAISQNHDIGALPHFCLACRKRSSSKAAMHWVFPECESTRNLTENRAILFLLCLDCEEKFGLKKEQLLSRMTNNLIESLTNLPRKTTRVG